MTKSVSIFVITVLLAVFLFFGPASAGSWHHDHHGHYNGYSRVGVFIGAPWFWGPPVYYHPCYPAYRGYYGGSYGGYYGYGYPSYYPRTYYAPTGYYGYYNTQRGGIIGAALGALAGQAIGGNTESTLIGMGAGAVAGAIAGNAVDQYGANQAIQQTSQVPQTQAYASPGNETPPGEWVTVPGRWVEGKWVPSHKVWVPINP